MPNEVVNHKNGKCIWYHTTTAERLNSILKHGLKINSRPVWQAQKEPWVYLSTEPWNPDSWGDYVILEVNLDWLPAENCGWAFADPGNEEEWANRWQLRVFVDIPADKIRKVYRKIK